MLEQIHTEIKCTIYFWFIKCERKKIVIKLWIENIKIHVWNYSKKKKHLFFS